MVAIKGCVNKKCRKQLPDNSNKYCPVCCAERKDQKDKVKDAGMKAGGIAAAGFAIVFNAVRRINKK